MGHALLWQLGQILREAKRATTAMSPCKNCGALLYWQTDWAYEVHSRVEYYEGCQGLVIDRYTHEIHIADLMPVKPKWVTPRNLCPNYDYVLQRSDPKVFDKQMATLF